MEIDDRAVLWSADPSDRADRPVLVLLHGYNSHEGDLFGLAPYLPLDPVIASVRAPLNTGYGYAWFDLDPSSLVLDEAVADEAADALLRWLERAIPTSTPVGLLGFSQGAAMALELLRRAPERISYVVNLAGFIVPGTRAGDARLAGRPAHVFWGRGAADPMIPGSWVADLGDWLSSHTVVDARVYEELGHSVSAAELGDVHAFITAQLTVGADGARR
ncbi:MAG TPA: alpha/beta fold hydrolase [Candidatus Lumbricidophila sp.]|nr:alpha/beta fold hydrolase [Candidatus Lumbricidophila sp.]